MREVPFFNYSAIFKADEEKYVEIFRDVGRRGAFILQKDVAELEEGLAKFSECSYALGMADGTEAITLALRAAGVGHGDEVIISSHTFIATASAIVCVGAVPVPVECGPDHLIDPAAVEAAVTSKTRCIMPTQLNGRTCEMDKLQAIADRHNLCIVEDAAQALGSRYKDQCAGTFGVAGTISFYPAKSLGCFGDGGAVLTNNEAAYEKMKILREHGRISTGEVVEWGYNCRLDNLQAAFLSYKLKSFGDVIKRRRSIALQYQRYLEEVKELTLPPAPGSEEFHFDTFQNYEIEADRRIELMPHLKQKGIGTLIQWSGWPVHMCRKLGFTQNLPKTEAIFERCLMIPMNMTISDADVQYVANTIREFYGYRAQ
jgi:dTDP-4-amino-4,6-dideoxygalactose transaminase